MAPTPALARGPAIPALTGGLSSVEVVNFALVIGAISAAMISAIWLIRERGKIEAENVELKATLGDAKAKLSRYQALLVDKDRRIVVWEGQGMPAEIVGHLPVEIGGPAAESEFLGFGRWLEPRSAARLEQAIGRLRSEAERFDLVLESARGHVLEAQGRVSGGRAFVRFVALANLRAEIAELKVERDRLVGALETLQTLLDALDMPVWLRDEHARLVWANLAYADAVEADSRTDALRRGLELLGAQAREKIRSLVTQDRPFDDKVSTVVRGDRVFYDVVEAAGEAGSAGVARNVSELEAVREELARTLRSHADTLDHLATPVAIFDSAQRLQFYNQAFQRLWELDVPFLDRKPTNAELLERLRADGKLPEPHSWREWKEKTLSVYHAVEPQPHLWHLPDGQTLNVFANAHPQGGATWVFDDLTEKVDLETRYNTLLKVQGETIDHLAEGVAVFGADGRLKLSNPAFRALWGITEAEAEPGTHIRAVAQSCRPSDTEGQSWKRFANVITSFDDERRTHEDRIELTSGLILDYALVPLPNAQWMATFVNMSDSVRVERALTDMNEALRKADALKNDFVQHVSYELRSPLTNIIGFTDLLKSPVTGDLNDRQVEYVDHISTSSSVLLTIVNDILDLATVDAGIMRLELRDLDLSAVLDEVAERIGDRLKESGTKLQVEKERYLGWITADPQRLKQILLKLLGNAVNYAPEGSTIQLRCAREGETVVFTVSDSGPGIPENVLKTVFDRFETYDQGAKRRGAGLGLSIVESFVSLHGGEVAIESRPGEGTTVTCRIPSGSRELGARATG
ncbi:MAG TPA: ATP-binding protein [Pararhizobium sp.]|nr:ATP-binding protein [Pararhizobium sp.]